MWDVIFLLGKNRDRLTIIADILKSANSGATKTHIMFKANLSFSLLEKYLDIVVNAGLLQVNSCKYTVTEQGYIFMKQYREFHERYLQAQKMFDALHSEREKLVLMCEAPN